MSSRLTITSVSPSVTANGVAYPSKRVIGDIVRCSAIVVCDGHVEIGGLLRVIAPDGTATHTPLEHVNGCTYSAELVVEQLGRYVFTIETWIDQGATIQSKIVRKRDAGQATANEAEELRRLGTATTSDHVESPPHTIIVDPVIASFGAWYEFFPRSLADAASNDPGNPRHGTLGDAVGRLDHARDLGFDIVYFPPIHPIGREHRKGKDNSVDAKPGDVGSPYAIGAVEGGHMAVHPQLGTVADVATLVTECRDRGLELALDIAYTCAPDHPWVTEHPEWFAVRPDGTIAYAENPPKRYQDIVPFDFDSKDAKALWRALADVIEFWHRQGVRVFRIDNPHTKPFPFWEWMIAELKRIDPAIIFLAEAFAHPEVMLQLSRVGFSVSYNHFPWQHAPWQLQQYFDKLMSGDAIEYFRGSAWPNTPDILTDELAIGLRQVYVTRLVLAATLSASYGLYSPVFELQESEQRPGSEEYMHNEKYELRAWNLHQEHSLAPLMQWVNQIRREHAALQHDRSLVFHHCENPRLVVYSKTAPERVGVDHLDRSPILVVANTDHHNPQEGFVNIDITKLGHGFEGAYEAYDLLSGQRYTWAGGRNYVRLDPWQQSAHVFALRPKDPS